MNYPLADSSQGSHDLSIQGLIGKSLLAHPERFELPTSWF
ncbi:uncharacterized protein METZ01_LOCUS124464, partial [marine metagenome]